MTDEKISSLPCKFHAAVEKAISNIERIQHERNGTMDRVWAAIESRVSVRVFLSILSVAVATIGLILGSLFYNQDHVLTSMAKSQDKVLAQIGKLREDMGVVKYRLRIAEGMTKYKEDGS